MVFQLTKRLAFPDPHWGDPDGLLAIGGDLSVDRLILAYSNGIFPWYAFREKVIQWWCPLQRFVTFPEEIHISHSMRTEVPLSTVSLKHLTSSQWVAGSSVTKNIWNA